MKLGMTAWNETNDLSILFVQIQLANSQCFIFEECETLFVWELFRILSIHVFSLVFQHLSTSCRNRTCTYVYTLTTVDTQY